jgi:RHS repeat-associated protein
MRPRPGVKAGSAVLATLLAGSAPLAQAVEVEKFYHLDALGSVRAITDPGGTVLERFDYHPYGEDAPASPTTSNTLRFTGKERDPETAALGGLDYFGARYYFGRVARFTSVDPKLDAQRAIADPQQWNRYAYARDNPIGIVDPDGRESMYYPLGNGSTYSLADHTVTPDPPVGASLVVEGIIAAPIAGVVVLAEGGALALWATATSFAASPKGQELAAGIAEGMSGAAPGSLSGGAALAAQAERTALYRAVKPAELADIAEQAAFRNPVGAEVKYFSTTEAGARSYAAQAEAAFKDGPYSLVKTSIPSGAVTPGMTATVDRGISTVVVPTEKLNLLSPPETVP